MIVDTSVFIDYLQGNVTPQVEYLRSAMPRGLVEVGDLVAMEILRGIRPEAQYRAVRSALSAYPVRALAISQVVSRCTEHYRALRARGITMRSSVDCLIAAYCIATGTELLHSDRDFDPFEEHLGLRVVR